MAVMSHHPVWSRGYIGRQESLTLCVSSGLHRQSRLGTPVWVQGATLAVKATHSCVGPRATLAVKSFTLCGSQGYIGSQESLTLCLQGATLAVKARHSCVGPRATLAVKSFILCGSRGYIGSQESLTLCVQGGYTGSQGQTLLCGSRGCTGSQG